VSDPDPAGDAALSPATDKAAPATPAEPRAATATSADSQAAAAITTDPLAAAATAADGIPANGGIRRLTWFRALLRLWGLRAVDAEPRGNPRSAIIFMSLSWLAAWVAIDWWQRQPQPEFAVDGIPLLAWYALAALALSACLRATSRPHPSAGATLALALGAAPWPLLLVSVAAYLVPPTGYRWLAGAVALYVLGYLMRGLRALTGRSQPVAALSGVLFIAAFMWLSDAADAIPDLWNPRENAAASGNDASMSAPEDLLAVRESALFEQADRIDDALEPIQRVDSGNSEAFFLGFAGVGEQKVFAQEIGLAERVLGARYRIGNRHLSLINDERDLERAPLASVTGLNYALQGLAARMDLDRDVLFLAIASHGSQAPSIAVSNSQFPLMSLTGEDLEGALRDAGIRWRVIVISACYAGGFIDALRNAKTIVITAAAKDRTSFGCSNDSDLTYFGEAFYRDALPAAKSLREAFETAKTAIAARERREHETPSNPQAYFGSEMERKLAELGQQ
jgi:hypothetical protein